MKAELRSGFLLLVMAWFGTFAMAESRTYVYEKGSDTYEIALLRLALDHTIAGSGPYTLVELGEELTEGRALVALNQGRFDVTFMVLDPVREQAVLPVRIDITRGIQGLRIFLVHSDALAGFSEVKTLDELRDRYVAGFGAQWSDLPVLRSNGFHVETATETSALYQMLEHKRFDFFPRGVNEVWDNLEQHRDWAPHMAVERSLALFYPLVQCFVVAKTNQELATRIQRGLEASLADGSMKRLFLRFHQTFLQKADLKTRRIFYLVNPSLPLGGPTVDTSWWMSDH
jgi:hypothetical protein